VALRVETVSRGGALDVRRPIVVLAVLAAHVALLVLIGRATRQASRESVEVAWIPLAITDAPTREDATLSTLTIPEPVTPRARPLSVSLPRSEPQEDIPSASPISPAVPRTDVDWFAEARSTAQALDDKARRERARRRLDGPSAPGLTADRHGRPACPFEKCEDGWGEGFSVFKDYESRKGRIEKVGDGEVIRWTSDRCYQILVTPNLLHRGMTRCIAPLDGKGPRGDLFKHMKELPLPADRATDVP
jgi:hypothetical protein